MRDSRDKPWWRFRRRTLIIIAATICVAAVIFLVWWFRPFVIEHHYPNGALAIQCTVRRTLSGELELAGEYKRWYSNGKIGAIGRKIDRSDFRYWSPSGREITMEDWIRFEDADNGDGTFSIVYAELIHKMSPESQRELQRLISESHAPE